MDFFYLCGRISMKSSGTEQMTYLEVGDGKRLRETFSALLTGFAFAAC